ncbi:MAG: tetraacyldisaccharide 4'-kinase [Gemmatimonadaceae bacterium]
MNIEQLWYGDGVGSRAFRGLITPFGWLYGGIVSARNGLYDHSLLKTTRSSIPVVSVGNLTVGGTGKTPFSAYIVQQLREAGHRPAVVMRGYGDDEVHLHARINPDTVVVADRDRVAGIAAAVAAGADVAVLDDGFQHRRARRDLEIVLVSAEKWRTGGRMLPAGPFREPFEALRRADVVVVTQKSATDHDVAAVIRSVRQVCGSTMSIVVARLEPRALVSFQSGAELPLEALRNEKVLAVAGIGDPTSFFEQLEQLGAVVTPKRYRDHHAYTAADAAVLHGETASHKYAVTTEKDAVKLARLWPAKSDTLWYLSQAVRVTEGASFIAAALAKLFPRATSIA